jgi:drug/metabolite transporter (DMT)-like permease
VHLAVGALVAVTAVWGSTFFLLKGVVTRIPVPDFLAARFWIAAVVLIVISPRAALRLSRSARRQGALLGLVYAGGQLLQTAGLEHTSASVSGFVTGMYVVFTPAITALLLRQRLGAVVWWAVGLAAVGLGVLSLQGLSLGYGETITVLSALLYALHIVGLGRWSRSADAYGLAVVQMIAIAFGCTLVALPGGVVLPSRAPDLAVLIYMAVLGAGGALVVQTWAQTKLSPARAAVVMTTEPVWAGAFAVTLGGEPVGWRLLVGGSLVLVAMSVAEFAPRACTLPVGPERE